MIKDDDRIKKKVEFFYNEKCRVHISRVDKTFWRGMIVRKKSDDVYEFVEDKFGAMLLFVDDIYEINLCRVP